MGARSLEFTRWTRPDLLSRIWQRIQSDDCFDLAAQISFFFSLSLFPFCLVLAVMVGSLPSTALWTSFATWIVTYLPNDSQRLIFSTILGLANYPAGFLSFGLITAVWSASTGFVSLMESLSVVHGVKETRAYWRKHAIAACVTLLAMVFFLIAFGVTALGHWGFNWFADDLGAWNPPPTLWKAGRWLATVFFLCLGVDLVNYVLPDTRKPWRWLTPGTALVVLGLVVSSAGFNVYVRHFSSYPRIYGAIGGFIILMLWIYVASLILLVGAETDREIQRPTSQTRPE